MSSLGVDLRDWFRPGSGVTVRYLLARLRWVGYDSPLARALREVDEEPVKAKPTTARLRERAAQIEAERREAASG